VLTEKNISIHFDFYIYGIMLNDGQNCIHPDNVKREGRKKAKKKKRKEKNQVIELQNH